MNTMMQLWIWLEVLRTNWRAIQLRLMAASPALSREIAAIAERLKSASPQQFADILDDLLELIADTEAADYVRGLIAGSTLPEGPAISASATREEDVDSYPDLRPEVQKAELPEVVMAQTGKALADRMAEPERIKRVSVFFATNRQASGSRKAGEEFGYGWATRAVVGQVSVSIPDDHKKGRLEKPGFFEIQNMQDHFVIGDMEVLEMGTFRSKLAQRLDGDSSRDLLVFIHGFNVSFEDALLRGAAQIRSEFPRRDRPLHLAFPRQPVLLSGRSKQRRVFGLSSGGVPGRDRRRTLAPRSLAGA